MRDHRNLPTDEEVAAVMRGKRPRIDISAQMARQGSKIRLSEARQRKRSEARKRKQQAAKAARRANR